MRSQAAQPTDRVRQDDVSAPGIRVILVKTTDADDRAHRRRTHAPADVMYQPCGGGRRRLSTIRND